jgi:hypothetical protein
MLKYLLFVFIVLGVGSSGLMYANKIMYANTQAMQNELKAQNAVSRLKQDIVFIDGVHLAPEGKDAGNHYELPDRFVGSRANQNGVPLLYCPYASRAVVAATDQVPLADGTSYDITVDTTLVPEGYGYVTHSDAPPVANVLALVIAPKKSADLPSCADVRLMPSGNYQLTGDSASKGAVYGVHSDEVRYAEDNGVWRLVSASDDTLMADIAEVAMRASDDGTLILEANGNHTFSGDVVIAAPGKRRTVVIKSSSSGVAANFGSGAAGSLTLRNVDLVVEDITFGNGVAIVVDGGTLTARRTSAPRIQAFDGVVELENVALGRNGQSVAALELVRSRLVHLGALTFQGQAPMLVALQDAHWVSNATSTLSSTLAFNANGNPILFQSVGSRVALRGTVINVNTASAQSLFYLDRSSELTLQSVVWNQSGGINYGIYADGDVSIQDSQLIGGNASHGIRIGNGARLHTTNSSVGSSSSSVGVGVLDDGGSSITGDLTVVAGTCTQGRAFEGEADVEVQDREAVAYFPQTFTFYYMDVTRTGKLKLADVLVPAAITCL